MPTHNIEPAVINATIILNYYAAHNSDFNTADHA